MEALKERGIGTGLHFRAAHHKNIIASVFPRCRYRIPNGMRTHLFFAAVPGYDHRRCRPFITALQQLAGQ